MTRRRAVPATSLADIHDLQFSPDVANAIKILNSGGVVALPTDTVYGLAASLAHPEAIARIFAIKNRSASKALPILVHRPQEVAVLAEELTPSAWRLVERFWPGPLTIVVRAACIVPAIVRGGEATVGLRMPADAVALAVIAGAGGALAVTSANRSGLPEAHSAEEVHAQFGAVLDGIIEGGPSSDVRPSTVVDASRSPVTVLRVGTLDPDLIMSALAEVVREP